VSTAPKERVQRAREAAKILRPHIGVAYEFDQDKAERLKGILRSLNPVPPECDQIELLQQTAFAITDLLLMRDASTMKDAVDRLRSIANAATTLAEAWSGVMSGNYPCGAIAAHLRGVRRIGESQAARKLRDLSRIGEPQSSTARRALEDLLAQKAWFERIDGVLSDDLWRLVAKLDPIVETLKAAGKTRRPAEHFCVSNIAVAWLGCTRHPPAVTRNREKKSIDYSGADPYFTPFQQYLREAVPLPHIGPAIVRDAVEALHSFLGR